MELSPTGLKVLWQTQEFLASNAIETRTEVNAKKEALRCSEALVLLDGINEMYVAKGKGVVHINLKKARPDDNELAKLMLGPTGNLRALALRWSKTLLIGFNKEMYTEVLA